MKATWSGPCYMCAGDYESGDEVVLRGRDWIHAGCAPGGGDE